MIRTYEDLVAFNKATLDAATDAGNALTKGLETLSKEAFAYQSRSVDEAVAASKQLQACKTAADVADVQTKLAKQSWETAIAQSKTMVDMANSIVKGAMDPIQARTKTMLDGFARA